MKTSDYNVSETTKSYMIARDLMKAEDTLHLKVYKAINDARESGVSVDKIIETVTYAARQFAVETSARMPQYPRKGKVQK